MLMMDIVRGKKNVPKNASPTGAGKSTLLLDFSLPYLILPATHPLGLSSLILVRHERILTLYTGSFKLPA